MRIRSTKWLLPSSVTARCGEIPDKRSRTGRGDAGTEKEASHGPLQVRALWSERRLLAGPQKLSKGRGGQSTACRLSEGQVRTQRQRRSGTYLPSLPRVVFVCARVRQELRSGGRSLTSRAVGPLLERVDELGADRLLAGRVTHSPAAREEGGRRTLPRVLLLSLKRAPFLRAFCFLLKQETGSAGVPQPSSVHAITTSPPMDKGVALCRVPPPPCSVFGSVKKGRPDIHPLSLSEPTDRRSRNITEQQLVSLAPPCSLVIAGARQVYRATEQPDRIAAHCFTFLPPCFWEKRHCFHVSLPLSLSNDRCPLLIEPACLAAS
ncbi:hypothetical protein MRX96_018922 [Rhipicephalus microplus]